MSKFKWGMISNGPLFQSLCCTLLQFENPKLKPFTRPGPDGSIDAFSGDGPTVFQFKHHLSPSNSQVRTDALDELQSIAKNRASGKFPTFWANTKTWTLVTNIQTNAQLLEMWKKNVQPAYAKEGLNSNLVCIEYLESLLIKHPAVAAAYFEGQNRIFLSLPEAIAGAKTRAIQSHELDANFVGRNELLDKAKSFLSDPTQRLLIITGSGGIGKSRSLLEIGKHGLEDKWGNVYWANVTTLEASTAWTAGIPQTDNTLILIDEPASSQSVRVLLEQLQSPTSPVANWKVVVAVRSQNSSIIDLFKDKKLEKQRTEVELERLTPENLEHLALDLLQASPLARHGKPALEAASRDIAKASGGHPIWTVIGVRILEDKGDLRDLPKDDWGVARLYVEQTQSQTPETLATEQQVRFLLNWIALFGEVRVDDDPTLDFITVETGLPSKAPLLDLISNLVGRRILQEQGRIRRIKPDIIRDYVLFSRFVQKQGSTFYATGHATELIKRIIEGSQPHQIPKLDRVIESLNYLELIQRLSGSPVDLLGALVGELSKLASKGSSTEQLVALQLAKHFGHSRPREFTQICRAIRISQTPATKIQDKVWGEREITHTESVLEIPWALQEAARYATTSEDRSAILNELFELAKCEKSLSSKEWQQVHNDGKRAHRVLEKLIFSGPGFMARFDEEANSLALAELDKLKGGKAITEAEGHALSAVIAPLISLQRERTTWNKGSLLIERYLLNPKHQAFQIRKVIVGEFPARIFGWT
ncbi:MAG: hypothetical protein HY459_04730 [Parcubacteria group bacterium]|nr:hypothetical protein [Parcubacteria group bacterium]